jgi:CarD family transcriptional regulator
MAKSRTTQTARKKSKFRFKVGDKVVYPNHGVGIIENIHDRSIAGESRTFYSLKIISSETTVMVPVGNSQAVGLRKILAPRQATTVLKSLSESDVSLVHDWKGRYQGNCEKMRTGSIDQVAEVLRDLTYLSSIKNLSYRERKMLDKARFLVVSELAEATRRTVESVEEEVDGAMAVTLKRSADH